MTSVQNLNDVQSSVPNVNHHGLQYRVMQIRNDVLFQACILLMLHLLAKNQSKVLTYPFATLDPFQKQQYTLYLIPKWN